MSSGAIAILCVVAAAVITWLVLRSQAAALRERLARAEQELAAVQAALGSERDSNIKLREQQASLRKELELQANAAAEKLALLEQAETKLREAFQALSAQALQSNNQSFLELARTTLERYQSDAKNELEQRKQAVAALVDPIRKSLESVDAQVRELEKARSQAYGSLSAQVASLITTQEKLQSETGNLVKALRAPQVRGRWGEIQLRRVVELAGMLPYCDFSEQPSLSTDGGKLRPDVIVKLPGGKTVVVDAKAPLQAYLDALECSDEDARRTSLLQHAQQIRAHMTSLGSKAYWDQLGSTPDFVVMFLPGETFFSAALQHDPGLIEYGVSQRVIPSSPTTLIALLQAVAYGWRQETIAKSAQEISARGKELYERLCIVADYIRDLGASLTKSVDHYNKAIASLESRVLVTARKFPELGISTKDEIPELVPVEKTPRALQAPEMVGKVVITKLAASAEEE
ncbi:MAG: DNA recombination protein RmuC [Terriglobales bacterium]